MPDGDLAVGEEHQPVITGKPISDPRFESLDTRFHAMLSQLLSRPVWRKCEFRLTGEGMQADAGRRF